MLLATVCHHVNLQCIRESGSVIVLFAAMWLFSYMLPHHVLFLITCILMLMYARIAEKWRGFSPVSFKMCFFQTSTLIG